jgi:hypothetical protein
MGNDKTTGRLKRFFFRLMGPVRSRKILEKSVGKLTAGLPPFSFPLDAAAIRNVLIILPTDKLQVLRQLKNVVELTGYFRYAAVTLLAETTSAPLAGLLENVTIREYPFESKKLFSAGFNELNAQFRNAFDVCCLLTSAEDLVLLDCAGRTAAPVRVGYASAGGVPFLNVHVNPSAERVLASEWNCAMAEMLGAKKIPNTRWVIAKQTALEIDHLLKENQIDAQARPVGVDALFFRRSCGAAWAEQLVRTLLSAFKNNLYLYAEETQLQSEITWLARFDLPVLVNLSIPQIAGVAARSGLVMTGNTLLFGLAAHLATKVVGIFRQDEFAANCPPQSLYVKGVPYEKSPGKETIEIAMTAMVELLGVS